MTQAAAPGGLGSTLGFGVESPVGTAVVPTSFATFQKNGIKRKNNTIQDQALHAGLYSLGSRRALASVTADGPLTLGVYDRGLGKLFQQMLGGVPTITQIGATTVYNQVYQPADPTGKSLTIQSAKPTTSGLIVPFTWNGCKVTDWSLEIKTHGFATLSLTIDAFNESITVTYTAPSYVKSNLFSFAQASLLLGGTVATTAGVAALTGGVAPSAIKGITIKGKLSLDTNRIFIGGAGIKSEQLTNGWWDITGTVEAEFANTTDILTAFYVDGGTPLQLSFAGPLVGPVGSPTQASGLQVLIPQIHWDDAPPSIDGPGILQVSAPFTGLDDGTNAPIQLTYTTLDSTP